jgi:hypothetical protein
MRSSAIQARVAFLSLANAACKDEPAEACPAESRAGLLVEVRDARTGSPVAAGATVIARDGRFVATLTPAPDGLVQLGLYERPGRYRVEISRPGYRSQVLESVRVVEEGCNVQTVRVAAALAPAI